MKEIGGYIELDKYSMPMLHHEAIALNCGRNALAYLIRTKKIKNIALPKFLCSSVSEVCKREKVEVRYYHIGKDFLPDNLVLKENEWLYLVNYYGQLSENEIKTYSDKWPVIVDNAQAYYDKPVSNVDTLYTCRKFFGVADGAFLYSDCVNKEDYEVDESYDRMKFLLGRFERTASEFYNEYSTNNSRFRTEDIKYMSKLTRNLLHGINYETIKKCRTENFEYLHEKLKDINRLDLIIPEGAFMYPLYINNGRAVRKQLQEKKIYVPTLWPDVFEMCSEDELEYDMAQNIIPIPVDQRYDTEDMDYIVEQLKSILNER